MPKAKPASFTVKDMLVFDQEVTHNVCQLLIFTVLNYMQRAPELEMLHRSMAALHLSPRFSLEF